MDSRDARGFVADFNRAYDEMTELRRLCSHRYYGGGDAGGGGGHDFFQLGRRGLVPEGFVERARYRYVTEEVVGALCEGEKRFVAERLDGMAESGAVPTVEADGPSAEAVLDAVGDADGLLVPRGSVGDAAVEGWRESGSLRRLGDGEYLVDGTEEETGCWVHRHDGESAFVTDSEGIGVVQKRCGEVRAPSLGDGSVYDEVEEDDSLGAYFREADRDGFVEVVYRVVLSEPVVDGGVRRVVW